MGYMVKDIVVRALLLLWFYAPVQSALRAGVEAQTFKPTLALKTNSVGPNRFVAVHGRRAVIMGYPEGGLEIWAYPFQILSNYQVGFKAEGTTTAADGRLLLRRVDYKSDSITRTYVGPDYLIREKLFVPLEQAAAVISYEVEGIRPVEINVSFQPVLNLMWPAALGGQYTRWIASTNRGDVPGFIISEPGRGFSAVIGSRDAVGHSDTVNSTIPASSGMAFSLRPSASAANIPSKATVYVALNPAGTRQPLEALQKLSTQLPQLEIDAATHYRELKRTSLQIRTPDQDLNASIASSVVALDQAWVCNDLLGCGMVAGYGPSRDQRRPQYAWFFGGDGLVAANALISAGEYSRAREELGFIQKYQDSASGMIWHELSQSAGFIDWSKYPYMYVHVDISFDYLATLARYVAVSGDIKFAEDRWPSVAAAYLYCQSQINSGDHLPHIPPDKEASDEQHRPADDLALTASWIAAASGFAQLATLTGHADQVQGALQQVQLTRQSISAHYWNAAKNFWFDGHTQSGEPIFRQAAGPTQLLVQQVFSPEQNKTLLSQLASANFQTDWGIREVAASSKDYNPYSYGAGSVSALGSAEVAITFWQAHRPETAWALWNGIAQWGSLDSPGHIHEVLAGNFFHEETESVPEQTWSSAGFLDATVRGLFGLEIDGVANNVRFAPHIPAEWDHVTLENICLPHSTLGFEVKQSMTDLDVDIRNQGSPTTVTFEPQIPLGAELVGSDFNGTKIVAATKLFSGDEHAKMTISVPPGASHLQVRYQGGISLMQNHPVLHVGDSSSQLKIVEVRFHSHVLSIEADLGPGGENKLKIRTPWKITAHQGGNVNSLSPYVDEISIDTTAASVTRLSEYTRGRFEIAFMH